MRPVIVHVDAFTDTPFSGNPAVVCLWPARSSDTHAGSSRYYHFTEELMQDIAREMNVSETAFLERLQDGYSLRWFTPVCEMDICGHATLAAAHVLWERAYLTKVEEAQFHTKSGILVARRQEKWIELEFPSEPEEPATAPFDLGKALGVHLNYVGWNQRDYLIEVDSEKTLRKVKPNLDILRTIKGRGFIVTSRSDHPDYDFASRFFAPRVGIDEDPVTGSAHCCLGPYWSKKLGKDELVGYQASTRGGIVGVRVDHKRVFLRGRAVTVSHGELVL